MSLCPLCGGYEYSTLEPKCNCRERYEDDMRRGIYPPGLSEEAKAYFSFSHWSSLHMLETDVRELRITPDEGRAKMEKMGAGYNPWPEKKRQQDAAKKQVDDWKLY